MQTPGSLQARTDLPEGASWLSLVRVLFGHHQFCRIDGDSMYPTLLKGDIVIYRPISKNDFNTLEGKIVIINHPLKKDVIMVKRVEKIQFAGVEVRGDNIEASTDSRQFGLIHRSQIIGLVHRLVDENKASRYMKLIKQFWY